MQIAYAPLFSEKLRSEAEFTKSWNRKRLEGNNELNKLFVGRDRNRRSYLAQGLIVESDDEQVGIWTSVFGKNLYSNINAEKKIKWRSGIAFDEKGVSVDSHQGNLVIHLMANIIANDKISYSHSDTVSVSDAEAVVNFCGATTAPDTRTKVPAGMSSRVAF